MSKDYHGIVLDAGFKNPDFLAFFKVFARKTSVKNNWVCYGISVDDDKIDYVVKAIQENLKEYKPYYAHFYKDDKLIIIFKKRVFIVSTNEETWKEVIEYGLGLGIPKEQLDFRPRIIDEENEYFK